MHAIGLVAGPSDCFVAGVFCRWSWGLLLCDGFVNGTGVGLVAGVGGSLTSFLIKGLVVGVFLPLFLIDGRVAGLGDSFLA